MLALHTILLSFLLPLSQAESLLGVYIFSRHGDRTAKLTPPTNLTGLGYQEIFTSGTYFRDRYVNATNKIAGINTDVVKQSQISASAPQDTVLQNSAQGFLQGLYPPVAITDANADTEKLRNGTIVKIPMNNYQLIPLQSVANSVGAEDASWLQGTTGCALATISSNNYYLSSEYKSTLAATADFYKTLAPLVNNTLPADQISYKNAYTIWDLINVAQIHNSTFDPNKILTDEMFFQARQLADLHEWNLAYNATDTIRAISGATLAAEILAGLNKTITGAGKSKFNIQFGAYANFQSFFGLAQLPAASADFYGVPDYASSMTFELFIDGDATPFPANDAIKVRFLFHNGTTSDSSEPTPFALFGQKQMTLSWQAFVDGMNKFAINGQDAWCRACGNTTGVCSGSAPAGTTATPSSSSSSGSGGVSKAVAGVIGAIVTLAVVLGLAVLVMLVGGMRLVSKKRMSASSSTGSGSPTPMSKSRV
ncbi:hypothetical protein MMC07_008720 [Pseudocyphellaria aurata]|nr:hypothetical protein [Pseudocyphellaria aurata]